MDAAFISIAMFTYNHERYIAQAIEGVLMQKTSYNYKLYIGEDCSTDNTKAICMSYAEKYKDKIELICTKQNNIRENCNNIWKACQDSGAKYVAYCEGDDYWVDPYKLQKQADFMEANPDYSICFTKATVINEVGLEYPNQLPAIKNQTLGIEDIIESLVSIMPSASLFFKNILPNPLPSFYQNAISGDIAIQLILANQGKIKYFPEKTVVYRHHTGGITKTAEQIKKGNQKLAELFIEADKYFDYKYTGIIKKRLLEMSKIRLIHGAKDKKGINRIKHYFRSMPDYLRYSGKINFKEIVYYHLILFFPKMLKNWNGK